MGEFGRIVLWVGIQLDPSPTRPGFGKRVGDRSRSEDGVHALDRNSIVQGFDHLLHPRKDIVGTELIDRQGCADEDGVCALRTRGEGEDEI